MVADRPTAGAAEGCAAARRRGHTRRLRIRDFRTSIPTASRAADFFALIIYKAYFYDDVIE